MTGRCFGTLSCLALLAGAAWFARPAGPPAAAAWIEVAPGVYRTPGLPAGHALVDGDRALLIDAPCGPEGLKAAGVRTIDAVLLTHHHRDTCAAAGTFLAAKVPVRTPKLSAAWLLPENVRKSWDESLPLRGSNAAYLVVPVGLDGIDCSLQDQQEITWRGWTVRVVATPGHSRDHVAYTARKGKDGKLLVFCGDALSAPGKLWSPYTTDWDHWTDAGLTPTAEALRKLAALRPAVVLPAHGSPITKDAADALTKTADAVAELAFLKSYERYTKKRLGDPPDYRFLAKEQAGSNGSLPWSQVSKSLFLTGNTYVLASKDNAFLVIDPWGKRGADQIAKLRADRKLGALEVVWFSHAHYDHYDGIYLLPDRDKFQVWTLDQVATPIAEPFLMRQPFLDARPVRIDRRMKDGETATWREYRFRFHHFPGQTAYTMAVETTIDGKKCLFTADNFFHQDLYSGTGGWMGLNSSFPLPYAASAQKVIDLAPEWVLAEHGCPFEFNAEDFRRRVRWGQASAAAADALSPSGNNRRDWDPSRIRVEPLVQKAKAGATVKANLVAFNPRSQPERLTVTLHGRGLTVDQTLLLEVPAGGTVRRELTIQLGAKITAGRQVFALDAVEGEAPDGADKFLVVDIE